MALTIRRKRKRDATTTVRGMPNMPTWKSSRMIVQVHDESKPSLPDAVVLVPVPLEEEQVRLEEEPVRLVEWEACQGAWEEWVELLTF
mmetsp:Transcript_108764/g.313373  ORF Transcript_108764/g.313373 Transcript_108764/m.313373 type:complete len:88 (-) Transcript_108764:288-551(-)